MDESPNKEMEKLAQWYITLRDKLEAKQAEWKKEAQEITSMMEKIETYVKEKSLAEGVESYRTPFGTMFFTMINRCNIVDWNQVLPFILETGEYEFLNHAVKKDAVRAYIEKTGRVPPGVEWATIRTFNCRKPSKD